MTTNTPVGTVHWTTGAIAELTIIGATDDLVLMCVALRKSRTKNLKTTCHIDRGVVKRASAQVAKGMKAIIAYPNV